MKALRAYSAAVAAGREQPQPEAARPARGHHRAGARPASRRCSRRTWVPSSPARSRWRCSACAPSASRRDVLGCSARTASLWSAPAANRPSPGRGGRDLLLGFGGPHVEAGPSHRRTRPFRAGRSAARTSRDGALLHRLLATAAPSRLAPSSGPARAGSRRRRRLRPSPRRHAAGRQRPAARAAHPVPRRPAPAGSTAQPRLRHAVLRRRRRRHTGELLPTPASTSRSTVLLGRPGPAGRLRAAQAAPGPGRLWLHTCLSFDGRDRRGPTPTSLRVPPPRPGEETADRAGAGRHRLVLGRGQIPYLQVQASP